MAYKADQYLGLNDKQIKALINILSSDEEVSDEQWNSVKSKQDVVAYRGFDRRKIIREFLSRAKVDAKSDSDAPVNYRSPNGTKFQLYSKNDARTDLLFLINLFLERGNNINKILLKCDTKVGAIIRRKAAAYGIVMEKRQSSTSSLTLARLSQAFPIATASLILKNNIMGKLKTKALAGVEQLPIIMQHTIFPSLIPSETESDIKEDLRAVAIVLNIETSIMLAVPRVKCKMEIKYVNELANQAKQFVDAAMNGTFIDDATKFIILKKALILDANYKLTTMAAACVAAARTFLQLGNEKFFKAVKMRQDAMNSLVASQNQENVN